MVGAHELIYHMLPRALWVAQPADQVYVADSLASEGFIHCTGEPEMLATVANRFYQSLPGDFVILCIATAQVEAEIKWEAADDAIFPHIYGPLNLDAIVGVESFPRDDEGAFLAPIALIS